MEKTMNITSNDQTTTWVLKDWHAFAQDDSRRSIYVRELIDIGSYEFESSLLSYEERLEIIKSVGADLIFSVMAEICVEKSRKYSKEVQFQFDIELLHLLAKKEIDGGPKLIHSAR